MNDIQWKNDPTREAYIDALESIEDPLAFAREWLEIAAGGDDARELLARQFRKDARQWCHRGPYSNDAFTRALMQTGLRAVDWHQVAGRILERAEPAQAKNRDDRAQSA